MGVLDVLDRNWSFANKLVRGHVALYRATRGLIGHRVPFAPPMLLLDHVGAKTGQPRTSALAYFADGDDLVIVGSKGGYSKHPAWFHNLKAHPETTVQVGSEKRTVRAHVANPHERDRLWPMVVEMYPGFAKYQERTERPIPLVILERRPE